MQRENKRLQICIIGTSKIEKNSKIFKEDLKENRRKNVVRFRLENEMKKGDIGRKREISYRDYVEWKKEHGSIQPDSIRFFHARRCRNKNTDI